MSDEVSRPARRSKRGSATSRSKLYRQSAVVRSAEEIELAFKNLEYTVKLEKKNRAPNGPKEKKLLDGITGIFRPRRLTAIMGSSGAGKTTLLSVLIGNSNSGKVEGSILANGESYSGKMLKEISGFVFQDDVLLPTMTVREAISMSATLRLPKTVSKVEKESRIDDILEIMHLEKAAGTVVGSPLQKGISGGERKRTAIGMEMVTNPAMLFLDEPTTGLDTFTAYTVILSLKLLAQQGRTVVATIHQPSTEIFNLFDDLIIMSRGRIAYAGPVDQVISYFARQGYQCPQYSNPSDYIFMEVLREFGTLADDDEDEDEDEYGESGDDTSSMPLMREASNRSSARRRAAVDNAEDFLPDTASERRAAGTGQVQATLPTPSIASDSSNSPRQSKTAQEACNERIESLLLAWKESSEQQKIEEECKSRPKVGVSCNVLKKRASLWIQFVYLLRRAMKNFLRNHLLIFARIFQAIFIGVIVGLVYVKTNNFDPLVQIRNKSGALYFIAVNLFFSASSQVLGIFGVEKNVFYREYNGGYYSIGPYYISKTLVEVPGTIIGPFLLLMICYYMIGLTPAFSSYLFIGTLGALAALCGNAYGILISALIDDVGVALAVAPLFLLPLIVVSGVFVAALPVYINWLKYISPIYYAFAGMLQTQFNSPLANCDASTQPCTRDQVFAELNYVATFSPGVDVVFLATIFAILWVAGFLALYWGAHRKK